MRRATSQQQRLKLPAFGWPLLELRRKGLVPVQQYPGCRVVPAEINVSLDSWKWRMHNVRVVVAPDMDPAELDFRFVAGLSTLLGWWPDVTPIERRDACIRAILRGNPLRLVMVAFGTSASIRPITIIKRDDIGVALSEFFT